MKFLLDYVFKVTQITPTPSASTAFLKQACVVVKPITPGSGVGVITSCTSQSAIAALTGNLEAQLLLSAGMSKVYILPMDDLDLADALSDAQDFYTVLISSDFSDEEVATGEQVTTAEVKASRKIQDILYTAKGDGTAGNAVTVTYTDTETGNVATVGVVSNAITVQIDAGVTTAATIAAAIIASTPANALVSTAVDSGDESDVQAAQSVLSLTGGVDEVTDEGSGLDVGEFAGVVGIYSDDADVAAGYAAVENRVGFYGSNTNKAKNMMYAFGKMLSNALNWRNQQYISMTLGDGVADLGTAETYFDDKVSFVISDDEFSHRLALFAVGGKAIIAPYISRNLQVDLQSTALSWIAGNQPQYTKKAATQLESALKDVVQSYIEREWIEDGVVTIELVEDNFVAGGFINISEPSALWRVFSEMQQTL